MSTDTRYLASMANEPRTPYNHATPPEFGGLRERRYEEAEARLHSLEIARIRRDRGQKRPRNDYVVFVAAYLIVAYHYRKEDALHSAVVALMDVVFEGHNTFAEELGYSAEERKMFIDICSRPGQYLVEPVCWSEEDRATWESPYRINEPEYNYDVCNL